MSAADLKTHFRKLDREDIFAEEREQHLPFITFEEIRPQLTANWLIKGILPRDGLGVLYGPPGSGKTFVLLEMLMAVSRGIPWRGRKTEQTGVVYLCPDGGKMVQNRIEAYKIWHGQEPLAQFAIVPVAIDLLGNVSGDDVQRVIDLIDFIERSRGWKAGIVAVDTVSRAMPGGDENAAKDMTKFIDNLARIGATSDCITLGVHHTPKSDPTVLRGHGALHGANDFEILVHDRIITIRKERDGEDGQRFGFRLEVVEIGKDEDGEPVKSCVAVAAEVTGGRTNASGRTETSGRKSDEEAVAMRTIANLIAERGEPLPQGTGFPSDGRYLGIKSSIVQSTLEGSLYSSRTSEAARKAWERVRNKLHHLGLIGVNGRVVWLPDNRTGRTATTPPDAA
jgi:KaiC/GvpD/RAD55 family RecA-like ATPase